MRRPLIAALALALAATVPTAVHAEAADSTFTIVEAQSGNALGLTRTGTDPVVTVDSYAGSRNQLWRLVDLGDGWSEIVNDGTGKVLSTVDGHDDDGAVVHLWDYLGSYPDQHWRVADAGGGAVTIANQGTGNRLLSTKDGQTATGTETQLWSPVSGRAGQTWKLVPTTFQRGITVHPDVVSQAPRTDVATGLEDVNHEIYGGIYSQLLFGEAFQEPEHDAGVSGMWRPI
ncbi:MAG: hypothetical protein QOI78_8334, partial [Actinomycetota bacterium]|nr:hypothetical protein [Actinomycetota bacterium]